MSLDVWTLTFIGGFVTTSTGLFLVIYWWHNRTAGIALWWAVGNGTLGAGIVLLSLGPAIPFLLSNILAPVIIDLGAVFAYIAARIFNRHPVKWPFVAGGILAWVAAAALVGLCTTEQYVAALGAGISAGLYAAAAIAFWLARQERLRARNSMIAMLTLHAVALFLLAAQFASALDFVGIPAINLTGIIHFVGLVYALGITLFLIMMLNERREEKYKRESLTDPLTGLANRRAFMDQAQRVLDRAARDGVPAALLAFDLDRFKRINDTFGHAAGDTVLRLFADTLCGAIRATTLAARLGGEEFVAILPGTSDEAALAIANRTRETFQNAARFVNGEFIDATVSVGVVASANAADGRCTTLAEMLAGADAALYQAKEAGRNRVILAASQTEQPVFGNVIRIA